MSGHYYAYKTHIKNQPSYALMPISKDAVYIDGMFYPEANFLLLLSRDLKERLQMVEKFDDVGKVAIDKRTGDPKQERLRLDTNYEYYLSNIQDLQWFADNHIVNGEEFMKFVQENIQKLEASRMAATAAEEPEKVESEVEA